EFEVDTLATAVTIVGPPTPSKNTTPKFSGEASEEGKVVVHILEGGKQISTATGEVHAGTWSATAPAPLPSGNNKFTAYATEKSGLGNEEGESNKVEFEVDTLAPSVAITKGPEARSNETTPSFTGTASENTEVTVHVLEGLTEVSTAKTTASAGKWSLTLSKALPPGNNKFSAYATEVSAINNEDGESNTVEFEVDTLPPNVEITKGPEPRSSNTKPTFEGTASENTEFAVHVKLGTTEVATGATTAAAGKWSISTLSKALPPGNNKFTAYATEKSGIGNGEG